MPNEKFNPIAQLPILPGITIASDEVAADIKADVVDSTYPPLEPLNKEDKRPQIEIRIKPPTEEELQDDTPEKKHLMMVRAAIFLSIVLIVFIGIFLTLTTVPKIFSNASDFSKSFSSLFISKKIATTTNVSNQAPVYIPLIATSTPTAIVVTSNPIVTKPITVQPVVETPSATTYQPKSPAKIISNIISTNIIGNRTIVKFNVQNVGETTSGVWSFAATLPSSATPKYYSVAQRALTPKSGVVYTLGFTQDQYTNTPVQITIYQ